MADKIINIGGTEYLLTKVGQVRINGGRCDTYEVRKQLDGQNAYHQLRDIHVPLGRSMQEHMEWLFDEDFDGTFSDWSKENGAYAA